MLPEDFLGLAQYHKPSRVCSENMDAKLECLNRVSFVGFGMILRQNIPWCKLVVDQRSKLIYVNNKWI